jgi:hypothetical protein
MAVVVPEVIARYFEADARRDNEAVLSLFTDGSIVVDENETHGGIERIRAWREGPASRYKYTTELFDTQQTAEDEYIATGRIEGNFPGGTADLKWRFTVAGDRIKLLQIGI